MLKNPIYAFTLIVILFGLFLILFVYGLYGIFTLLYLIGTYSILLATSFLLKTFKAKFRIRIEYSLIAVFILAHTLSYLHWDVGTELYFDSNKTPFSGHPQNFIVVFSIDGQEALPNNQFTDNKIFIPQNGILLTSSNPDRYKHRYSFEEEGSWDRFVISHIEQCDCYGEANHKFKYIVGAINDSGKVSYQYRDSVLSRICERLDDQQFRSGVPSGYKTGTYLDQKEIVINYKNLTSLPPRLVTLRNLESLNIHSNDLQTIPKEIHEFRKLKNLTIGFNGIRQLPEHIGSLKSLERLAVNGNELTDLPDTLLTLPNLRSLSVNGNNFDEKTRARLYDKYKKKGIELRF